MKETTYGINIVCKKTGLSSHAIRKWESRYNAVTPQRSVTNRRLYSESNINRLRILKRLTDSGYSIGHIANLNDEKLLELLRESRIDEKTSDIVIQHVSEDIGKDSHELINAAISAVIDYNTSGLEKLIIDCSVRYGNIWTINYLLVPTIHQIGMLWRQGKIKISHEHLASETLRTFLGNIISNSKTSSEAPVIIVTTPSGQLHEFGAILAAASAATEGWNVCYLGPNLPSEEIASATLSREARVVALSVVFPADDPNIINDIIKLREILNSNIKIILGGRAYRDYMKHLISQDIIFIDSLDDFRSELENIRRLD